MARDRLAALRRGQGGSPASPTSPQAGYEMSGLRAPETISSDAKGDGPADFYAEISTVQDLTRQFDTNVGKISELHSRSLNNMDEAMNQQYTTQLDELIAETRNLGNSLKQRIESLGSQAAGAQDVRIRKNQASRLDWKFMDALQNYQNVEKEYRSRYKQRVERQFKIVKPDATPEEVAAVVNDTSGSGNQVFAQALTSSTRYGESRAAYREVQERHEDILRIEQTISELAQLFSDMSILIQQQDEQIDNIQKSAIGVAADTEAAHDHTVKAVKSARGARRKRWICFWLTILILIIIAVIVVVSIHPWTKN
ncbi:hypothetical protein JAAARDRAFT_124926 [Jaapia argillacea MUCL 33604]|uniref:t-SNARE coiled-coil homology domain-containing protein n=1 Tax=Jaapia argillacea MUCL 33604 TaxID=933084 RepID=A0A067Q0V2_9AGAM|nr:hypothetical protein JAAARDRAFT_124926 [Jaapia argillacea MUCL 33604]